MKDWFYRTFFANEPLGDKILSVLIGIFAIIFVCGWAILILWFIMHSIFDFLKWTRRKDGIPNFEFEDKMDSIEEKIGNIFKLPLKLIPDSVDTFFYYNRIKLKFAKSILIGFTIPIAAFLIWMVSSSSPVNDFNLITKSSIAKGQITSTQQETDVVETNDGRTSEQIYFYDYDYSFVLPNGKIITARGSEPGEIPEHLMDLDEPFPVQVEYLADNPNVSRIKGMDSNDTTILQWIRHRMVIQTIVFLFFCYWGFTFIRTGLKEYKSERANVTTNEN